MVAPKLWFWWLLVSLTTTSVVSDSELPVSSSLSNSTKKATEASTSKQLYRLFAKFVNANVPSVRMPICNSFVPPPVPQRPTPMPTIRPVQWTQVGEDLDGLEPNEQMGSRVSLSSDGATLAMGGRAVRLYALDASGGWTPAANFQDSLNGNYYNVALSSNGRTLAVGDYAANENGRTQCGAAIVVADQFGTGQWEVVGSRIAGYNAHDRFGWSIALNGNARTIVIGTYLSPESNRGTGYFVVYERKGIGYYFVKKFEGPKGFAVSLDLTDDGSRVVVGELTLGNNRRRMTTAIATEEDEQANTLKEPSARSFDAVQSSRSASVVEDVVDELSKEISQKGSFISSSITGGTDDYTSGFVHVFRPDPDFDYVRTQVIDVGDDNDRFGYAVSMSGDGSILAVGAEAGSYVQLYRSKPNDNLNNDYERLDIPIYGTTQSGFGSSLDVSSNGRRVIVGGRFSNDGGEYSGRATVFSVVGNLWFDVGRFRGDGPYDQAGWDVSLSADGRVIAIGAPGDDDNGSNSGDAKVFRGSY